MMFNILLAKLASQPGSSPAEKKGKKKAVEEPGYEAKQSTVYMGFNKRIHLFPKLNIYA